MVVAVAEEEEEEDDFEVEVPQVSADDFIDDYMAPRPFGSLRFFLVGDEPIRVALLVSVSYLLILILD